MAKVAILVLNFNGKKFLERCIRSILNQTFKDFEIYVVDNGSSDGSIEFIKNKFPEVKIISFNKNLGFAGAYNRAVRLVKSEYVVLVNNDTYVDKNWLKHLVEEIEKSEKIFAVGSKILFAKNPKRLDNIGLIIAPIGGSIILGHLDKENKAYYNVRRLVGGISGASMIIRRKLFLELGGFDPKFFAYHEDVDLCWRALKRGFICLYTPKSIIFHEIGGSWGVLKNPKKMYLITRNKLYTLIKNRDSILKMFVGILVSSLIDLAGIFFIAIFTRDFSAAGSIARAYFKVLKDFRKLLKIRKKNLAKCIKRDSELERKKLIASFGELFKWGIDFLSRLLKAF